MWHVWEGKEVPIGLWWEDLRERDYLEDLGVEGTMISEWFFKK